MTRHAAGDAETLPSLASDSSRNGTPTDDSRIDSVYRLSTKSRDLDQGHTRCAE